MFTFLRIHIRNDQQTICQNIYVSMVVLFLIAVNNYYDLIFHLFLSRMSKGQNWDFTWDSGQYPRPTYPAQSRAEGLKSKSLCHRPG